MICGYLRLYDESGNQLNTSYTMSDTFNDASKIVNDNTYLDSVIRGLLTQPSQSVDQNVDNSLWNKLFRGTSFFGFDVVALNIQRGRDHGIPSYNTYRQYCGFSKLSNFSDMISGGKSNPSTPSVVRPFVENVVPGFST